MNKYVIDTNFFVNLQRQLNLGAHKEEVVAKFIALVRDDVKVGTLEFLTTPEVLKELRSFFEEHPQVVDELLSVVAIASPSLSNLQFDGTLFNDLVSEIGIRLYRGLRVAEEPIKALLSSTEKPTQETVQTIVGALREKYRRTTREGFLDSTTDLGLILLAKEKDAVLVTSDNGLLMWGRKFGCTEMTPEVFSQKIQSLRKAN